MLSWPWPDVTGRNEVPIEGSLVSSTETTSFATKSRNLNNFNSRRSREGQYVRCFYVVIDDFHSCCFIGRQGKKKSVAGLWLLTCLDLDFTKILSRTSASALLRMTR